MVSKNNRLFRTIVLLAALPLAMLAVAGVASAQAPRFVDAKGSPGVLPEIKSRSSNFVELPETSFAGESSRGANEGIVVHGHWKIDVKNSDGTLAETRDFENALSGSGAIYLVGALSGYLTPADWMIVLGASSGNGPCVATFQFCGVVHNLSTYPALGYCTSAYYCSGSTLNYAYNFGANLGGPFSIVLSGQITSNQTGSVGVVYSILSACSNTSSPTSPSSLSTTAPSACTNSGAYYGPFTATTLGSPIAVTSGQIIQVTVTITFS